MKAPMTLASTDRFEPVRLDDQMTELSLLLPMRQAQELSQAARQQGVSMGRFVRELLQQAVDSLGGCSLGGRRVGNPAAD